VKLADDYDNSWGTLAGINDGNGEEARKIRDFLAVAKPDAGTHPETRRAKTRV
jgi:hypothetical protein